MFYVISMVKSTLFNFYVLFEARGDGGGGGAVGVLKKGGSVRL